MNEAMRLNATKLFMAGVAAADPAKAVLREIEKSSFNNDLGRCVVIAIGKAAIGMARAVQQHVSTNTQILVVTNYENEALLEGAQVYGAAHPVPDENGHRAAKAVMAALAGLDAQDHVIALISGGGSALLPAPVSGISLADKASISQKLLAAGVDIDGMNLVRQKLSRLKGGGLLRLASPAKVTALILSDVIGDDLRVIASGPTAAPIGTMLEAKDLLLSCGVWGELSDNIRDHFDREPDEELPLPPVDNRLIGSNKMSLDAMSLAAGNAKTYESPLVGDVCAAAVRVLEDAGEGVTLWGGETTVKIEGTGMGGRNQEMALRVALLSEQAGIKGPWVFLSGGTDGRDGPTDAAGGLVDDGTLARMRANGVDPMELLNNNDSYHALQASGDLLMTEATGTNVADLQVMIRPEA